MAFQDPNAPIIARKFATGIPPNQRIEIDSEDANAIKFFSGLLQEVEHGELSTNNYTNAGTLAQGTNLNLSAPNLNALTWAAQLNLSNEDDATSSASLTADKVYIATNGAMFEFRNDLLLNANENFQLATLAGTWANIGGGWPSTSFRKDPDGYIYVAIAATGGAAPPSTIFTLPPGYRPSTFQALHGEGNLAFARATVLTTGVVQYNVGSTTNVIIRGRFPASNVP